MGDIFEIGLGNNDTETRKRADSDFVSFWNEEAKKLSWFQIWDKTLDWNHDNFFASSFQKDTKSELALFLVSVSLFPKPISNISPMQSQLSLIVGISKC